MQNYFPNIIIPVLISAAVSIITTNFILSSTEKQFETQMKINSVNNKINELRIVSDEMENLKLSEDVTAITIENYISIYETYRKHIGSLGDIVRRNKHLWKKEFMESYLAISSKTAALPSKMEVLVGNINDKKLKTNKTGIYLGDKEVKLTPDLTFTYLQITVSMHNRLQEEITKEREELHRELSKLITP